MPKCSSPLLVLFRNSTQNNVTVAENTSLTGYIDILNTLSSLCLCSSTGKSLGICSSLNWATGYYLSPPKLRVNNTDNQIICILRACRCHEAIITLKNQTPQVSEGQMSKLSPVINCEIQNVKVFIRSFWSECMNFFLNNFL